MYKQGKFDITMNNNNYNKNLLIKIAFLFFLSYVFGVIFHNMIHELGHAVTVWLQGGTITGFYFHPFNSCYNSSTYVPNHLLLYSGGAFFGLPLTILLMLFALKYRSPIMFPLIVTGTYGFFSTGIWMLKSIIYPEIQTDYTYMIELGTPGFLMLIIGIIYILFGLLARIFFLPLAGIDFKSTYKTRFAVYLLGILPWYLLNGLFNLTVNDFPIVSVTYFLISVIFYLIFEAFISLPLQRNLKLFRHISNQQIKNIHFAVILFAIFIIYGIMIFVNTFFPLKI